jgi:hypothetical protein
MKIKTFAAFALALCPLASSAQDKNTTYTDPAKVDADYAVQGEYLGKIGEDRAGVQVIALGGGKFDAVSFVGGLPGDGWEGDADNRTEVKGGETKEGVTKFHHEGVDAEIKDGKMTLSAGGNVIGTLERVERKSPTLGAAPPEGAVVLFDGDKHGADLWKGGKVSEDGLLAQGCMSKQAFGDFTMHMEFRTPYKPFARGQGRGNSGFYAQARYEVQVLDSFGLAGKHNECGGIYSTKDPRINMCYPPLQWQTYDIEFTAAKFEDGKKVDNAKMTVRHNGVLVHDGTVCDHSTTASKLKEGPEPGPIYFQDHGNPVHFRNIWVVPK